MLNATQVHYVFLAYCRSGSIITDLNIVVNISVIAEAQSDVAKLICQLLSREVNVTYNDAAYVVEEVSVTDSKGQSTSKHICLYYNLYDNLFT